MLKFAFIFLAGMIFGTGSFVYLTSKKVDKHVAYAMYKKDPIGTKIKDLGIRVKSVKK